MNIEAPIEAFEAQPTPKRPTVGVRVGGVLVGGTAPVVVQSMTTRTRPTSMRPSPR